LHLPPIDGWLLQGFPDTPSTQTSAGVAHATERIGSAHAGCHWLAHHRGLGWLEGLAGWVGSKIMGTDAQMGLILNIVVGIVGGLIGGFLLRGGGLVLSFVTCLLGAVILLAIVKLISRGRVSR
jgi:uncharacterized membrane protein YeaQ/YmgE (transglycosylase-associated protein family)